MKKLICALLVIVSIFALVGCGKTDDSNQKITVSFSGDPETIDPALCSTVDAAVICNNAFVGLYGYEADANGNPKLVARCAEEIVAPTANADGSYTYVITLKKGLKWSDGSELKASDFVYAWNRAAKPSTGGDYGFLYEVICGYDELCADESKSLDAVADNSKRTITLRTPYYCAYFDQLLAFATFFPVKEANVTANENWATSASTYITNGAFRMKSWTVGSEIIFEKNPNYVNAKEVQLQELKFFLSEDDTAVFANFRAGEIQYTTRVPVDQIPVLKQNNLGKDFFIGDYIGTWFLEFNVNASFKPGLANVGDDAAAWAGWTEEQNSEVRYALGLLIDRNYIVNSITAAGQQPAYGFVPAGMSDGNGNIFREEAEEWWSVDPADYDSNVQEALSILKKYYNFDSTTGKFTNFPKFDAKLNNTTGNVAILTAVQNMWNKYGIEFEMDQRAWSILTTEVTAGNFTCSRMGWIADYNDPVNFLEIYLSNSGNNHPQLGKSGYMSSQSQFGLNDNQPWSAYDALVSSIKSEVDPARRAELMYEAEEWLREECCVLPVYYYTNPYLCSENLEGFLYSSLGWVNFEHAHLVG